jgi:ribosomal protein S27AE
MDISERREKPKACPQCGDPGFVNPTTGRWQCGNAGCDNGDEVEFDAPPTRGVVSPAGPVTRMICPACDGSGSCEVCASSGRVAVVPSDRLPYPTENVPASKRGAVDHG